MTRAPALFVSHGSPMFALEPGRLGPQLRRFGESLQDVRAVLVVSPHWQALGKVRVLATAEPETIHDFGGFPDTLYRLRYDAPGEPEFAADTARLLRAAGFEVELDVRRGRDHGAWVPMRHLLPDARLPVFQVSMPNDLSSDAALELGRALAPLREAGVLVVGSGSLTHNLYEFRQHVRDPEYAQQFAEWIADAVARNDVDALVAYRSRAPHAARAHPTQEHFLPLLVALGASDDADVATRIEGGLEHGTLSMDSYAWSNAPGYPIAAPRRSFA